MKLAVEPGVCIGCGMCVMLAPALFELDDEGTVVLLMTDVPDELTETARKAVRGCPSGAVYLAES